MVGVVGIARSIHRHTHKEIHLKDHHDSQQTFSLNDLEASLKALLPNKEDLAQGYICCENVGKPLQYAEAQR